MIKFSELPRSTESIKNVSKFVVRLFHFSLCISWFIAQCNAQEVVVYPLDEARFIDGMTDRSWVEKIGRDQRILVIPVVTADAEFDPANNEVADLPLGATLVTRMMERYSEAGEFWEENSYGRQSFQMRVLPRYYQIPLRLDDIYNPSFEEVQYRGQFVFYPEGHIILPPGRMRIEFTPSEDDTTISIPIDFGASPRRFSHMEMQTLLQDAVNTELGAGIVIVDVERFDTTEGVGGRISFSVPDEFVSRGTALRFVGDTPEDWVLIDHIGLDTGRLFGRPGIMTWIFESALTSFPFTAYAFGSGAMLSIQVRLENGDGQTYRWNIPEETYFATQMDWVSLVNATPDEITGSDSPSPIANIIAHDGSDGRYRITIQSGIPDVGIQVVRVNLFNIRGTEVKDSPGVYIFGQDGVTSRARQNATRYLSSDIVGQAISALMINEFGRSDNLLGLTSRPLIEATQEEALRRIFQSEIDPFEGFVVAFMQSGGRRRAVASYGFPKIGIRQDDYTFEHTTAGSYQINFSDTTSRTAAHEIGHKFGLHDLYDNSGGRYDDNLLFPEDWDVMDSANLAHTGAWHKHFFEGARQAPAPSWLPTSAVVDGPAAPESGEVSETYLITPLEYSVPEYDMAIGTTVEGRLTFEGAPAVKAVRLPLGRGRGDGRELNHGILLQNRQVGARFSHDIPQLAGAARPGGLYVVDSISEGLFDFLTGSRGGRNLVHPLADTVVDSVAQPILDTGGMNDINLAAAYPAYSGIRIDVQREVDGPGDLSDAKSYLVNVRRQPPGNYVDLHIEPWDAPPYESFDMWIEHGTSDLTNRTPLRENGGNGERPRWAEGYGERTVPPLNWARVRVRNFGTVDARNVRMQMVANTPGGIGDRGDWIELRSDDEIKDIPAGGEEIFNFAWNPDREGHTCLRAAVVSFEAGLGAITPADIDLTNNGAQENVTVVEMVGASPYRPAHLTFDVQNPLDYAVEVELMPVGVFEGLGVELSPSFLNLPPRGKRDVAITFQLNDAIVPVPELLPGGGLRLRTFDEQDVHIVGSVLAGDTTVPIGGLTYLVRPSHELELVTDVHPDPRGGGITIVGRTVPTAPFRPIEVMIRTGTTEIQWLELMTDSRGMFYTHTWPRATGHLKVAVRHPGSDGYASVASRPQGIRLPMIDLSPYIRTWLYVVIPDKLASITEHFTEVFEQRTGSKAKSVMASEAGAVNYFCSGVGGQTADVLYLTRSLKDNEKDACEKNGAVDLLELKLAQENSNKSSKPLYAYVKRAHVSIVRGLRDYIHVLTSAPELEKAGQISGSIQIDPANVRTKINQSMTQLIN